MLVGRHSTAQSGEIQSFGVHLSVGRRGCAYPGAMRQTIFFPRYGAAHGHAQVPTPGFAVEFWGGKCVQEPTPGSAVEPCRFLDTGGGADIQLLFSLFQCSACILCQGSFALQICPIPCPCGFSKLAWCFKIPPEKLLCTVLAAQYSPKGRSYHTKLCHPLHAINEAAVVHGQLKVNRVCPSFKFVAQNGRLCGAQNRGTQPLCQLHWWDQVNTRRRIYRGFPSPTRIRRSSCPPNHILYRTRFGSLQANRSRKRVTSFPFKIRQSSMETMVPRPQTKVVLPPRVHLMYFHLGRIRHGAL